MCFYVRFLNRTLNSSAAIYCVNKKFYKFPLTSQQAIEHTFHRRTMMVAESLNHISQHLSYMSLTHLLSAKVSLPIPPSHPHNAINGRCCLQKRLVQDRKYSDAKLDVLSALILAESSLHGPTTKERMLVLRVSLALAKQQVSFLSDNNI